MEKILLHSCCAPCSVYCVDALRAEGLEPTSLWFNPNIHPFKEYEARRDAMISYGKAVDMEVAVLENYGLRDFVRAVANDIENRCGYCYAVRLDAAAEYARDNGFARFTSSLLVSPYQKHDTIKAAAEAAAERYGVEFVYRDFRPGFRAGQQKARELGLYMQKYCGCVFSEEERYQKQITRDKERFKCE